MPKKQKKWQRYYSAKTIFQNMCSIRHITDILQKCMPDIAVMRGFSLTGNKHPHRIAVLFNKFSTL